MSATQSQDQAKNPSLDANTHFVFENKVFQVEGCYFSLTEGTREVIFNIPIGEITGSVKLASLCAEFASKKGPMMTFFSITSNAESPTYARSDPMMLFRQKFSMVAHPGRSIPGMLLWQ